MCHLSINTIYDLCVPTVVCVTLASIQYMTYVCLLWYVPPYHQYNIWLICALHQVPCGMCHLQIRFGMHVAYISRINCICIYSYFLACKILSPPHDNVYIIRGTCAIFYMYILLLNRTTGGVTLYNLISISARWWGVKMWQLLNPSVVLPALS